MGGTLAPGENEAIRWWRLTAEIELLRAKRVGTATKKAPDDEMQQLLSDRFASATKASQIERKKLAVGTSTTFSVLQAERLVLDAEMELSETSDDRIAVLTKHIGLLRQIEQEAVRKVEVGTLAPGESVAVLCKRLTAEIELLRAKRVAAASK